MYYLHVNDDKCKIIKNKTLKQYVIGCQLDWIDSLGGRCGLLAGNVQPGT